MTGTVATVAWPRPDRPLRAIGPVDQRAAETANPTRPLRVGLVCPYSFSAPGGVQSHVLGLARHLVEAGHDPQILAPGDLHPSVTHRLGPDRITSAGRTLPVRYNGSVARVNFSPGSAARVRRWLRGQELDLLHVHEPITPSIALLALRAAEVPVVATFHTATPRSRTMRLAGDVLRTTIDRIDAGIAVSDSARRVVVEHLGRDAVVIPNGIWAHDFGPPRPHPARLVFLGRVDEPRKGLDVLLAAVPRIRAAVGDLEVVVAGSGRCALPPYCTAVGQITDGDKARLLASAAVFVAPHRERESFGIVVLEAMASGVPVVASDIAAFSDLMGPAVNRPPLGRLFRNGDPTALADEVIAALSRPDADQRASARLAARRYDWSVVGAEVAGVYAAALAAAGVQGERRRASC